MKQVLTVSCKLQVSPEQSIKIDATLQAFAAACEYANQSVPTNLTNELAMQSLVYHEVRSVLGNLLYFSSTEEALPMIS